MSSLLANNILNRLNTEGNVNNFFSNVKKTFQPFIREQTMQLRRTQLFVDNLNFNYSGEDILCKMLATNSNSNFLFSRGYAYCTENEYLNAEYNCIFSSKNIESVETNINPQLIKFFDGFETKKLNYNFEIDTVNFFEKAGNKMFFSFTFSDAEIIDFLVQNDYIYCILKNNGNYHLCLSHLGLSIKSAKISFLEFDCFYRINLGDYFYGHFLKIGTNKITFLDNEKKIKEFTLGKKYYFSNGTYYFYNSAKTDGELYELALERNIQTESLFLYDIADLFGLSDFTDVLNKKRYNSLLINDKSFFFKKQFGDNLNGALNFFDYSLKKSYRVDYDSPYIKIHDNFSEFTELGIYKIVISSSDKKTDVSNLIEFDLKLYFFDFDRFVLKKHVCLKTSSMFLYFCNLKIQLTGLTNSVFSDSIIINITEELSCKLKNKSVSLENHFEDESQSFSFKQNNNALVKTPKKNPIPFCNNDSRITPFFLDKKEYNLNIDNNLFFSDEKTTKNFSIEETTKKIVFKREEKNQEILKVNRVKFRLDLSNL